MKLNKLLSQGKLPRTQSVIDTITNSAQSQWESMIAEGNPLWWGNMALSKGPGGGGGLLQKKIPGGKMVYYANKGKYNYLEILEKGRSRYDMKPALLASSRARQGENGTYLIIAFTRNVGGSKVSPKNNTINGTIRKVGSFMGKNAKGQDVRRNRYAPIANKSKNQDKKNGAYAVEQKVKGGGVQRSYMKFVCVSSNSSGWFYPAIMAHRFTEKLQKDIDNAMGSKVLKRAIVEDFQSIIGELIKKSNTKRNF